MLTLNSQSSLYKSGITDIYGGTVLLSAIFLLCLGLIMVASSFDGDIRVALRVMLFTC